MNAKDKATIFTASFGMGDGVGGALRELLQLVEALEKAIPAVVEGDPPPKAGYYLAEWHQGDPKRSKWSELWFNPAAVVKWWSARGYLGDDLRCGAAGRGPMDGAMKDATILRWTRMPKRTTT